MVSTSTVTVTGEHFGDVPGVINLGALSVTPITWSDTSTSFATPEAGRHVITVSQWDAISEPTFFAVIVNK